MAVCEMLTHTALTHVLPPAPGKAGMGKPIDASVIPRDRARCLLWHVLQIISPQCENAFLWEQAGVWSWKLMAFPSGSAVLWAVQHNLVLHGIITSACRPARNGKAEDIFHYVGKATGSFASSALGVIPLVVFAPSSPPAAADAGVNETCSRCPSEQGISCGEASAAAFGPPTCRGDSAPMGAVGLLHPSQGSAPQLWQSLAFSSCWHLSSTWRGRATGRRRLRNVIRRLHGQ